MRRFITPAVLACLLLTASSAEARIESQEVSQSASSVVRLLDARADGGRQAGRVAVRGDCRQARAQAAPLPWTSEEVTTPYTQAPTSTHGKVFFTLGGGDYVCSGTALLSGNKCVVWTAGHCVNEGPGAFATNWEFVPAYKDGAAPLGAYVAENLFTTLRLGQLGRLQLRPRRGGRRAGGWHGTHRPCRRARDRVQLGR